MGKGGEKGKGEGKGSKGKGHQSCSSLISVVAFKINMYTLLQLVLLYSFHIRHVQLSV